MKRLWLVILCYLSSTFLFGSSVADTESLRLARASFPDYSDYCVSASNGRLSLVKLVSQENWFEELCLVNTANGQVLKINIDEQSVLSARFIVTGFSSELLVEVLGKTHMGNGSLYLFDTKGSTLLIAPFVDFHHEGYNISDVEAKNAELSKKLSGDGEFSQLFRNGRLDVNYSYNPTKKEILIFGVVDYVRASPDYKTDTLVSSEKVSFVYRFDAKRRVFVGDDKVNLFSTNKW